MKIVRYKDETGVKLGAVKGDGVIDLTRRFPSLSDNAIELIQQWSEAKPQLEKIVSDSAPDAALANVRLLAPVARPARSWRSVSTTQTTSRRQVKRCHLIKSGSPRR
jgi:hypothetical protein